LQDSSDFQQLHPDGVFSNAIGLAVAQMTETLHATRIVCFTHSGYTAASISRYRPNAPITAITASEQTMRRCALMWGVSALKSQEVSGLDAMSEQVDKLLIENDLAQRGDVVIIVGGSPQAVAGRTNFLKLHTIQGDPISKM
jgi:pyruvate kinase